MTRTRGGAGLRRGKLVDSGEEMAGKADAAREDPGPTRKPTPDDRQRDRDPDRRSRTSGNRLFLRVVVVLDVPAEAEVAKPALTASAARERKAGERSAGERASEDATCSTSASTSGRRRRPSRSAQPRARRRWRRRSAGEREGRRSFATGRSRRVHTRSRKGKPAFAATGNGASELTRARVDRNLAGHPWPRNNASQRFRSCT